MQREKRENNLKTVQTLWLIEYKTCMFSTLNLYIGVVQIFK